MADDANYVAELDIAVPLASASAGEGDDEIRAVKRAVIQSFPGDPTGVYTSAVADTYNIAVVVGPRYLNSIPAKFATVNSTLTAYDTRLDALEAPSTAGQIGVGMIVMWAGGATYPTGWRICDGTAGTVDLRNKFVICAGSSYAAGSTGGDVTKTSDTSGSHTHTNVTTGAHALTVAQLPAHGHPFMHNSNSGTGGLSVTAAGAIATSDSLSSAARTAYSGTVSTTAGQQIGGTGGGEAHTHTGGTAAADGSTHSHSVNVVPPYYALVFIQYTGA
jgi:microcystin-dependent protein